MRGWLRTPAGLVPRLATGADWRGRVENLALLLGHRRGTARIPPGLYAVGRPDADSPVLVTCNYPLTANVMRRRLGGVDAWVLVIETLGVNVWCAAGKGTFSTEEVAARIASAGLDKVVSHRKVILPQLAAPGVAAREIKRLTGFEAVFGPIRAADLPAYLQAGMRAEPHMRRETFPLSERLAVALVEVHNNRATFLWALPILFLLGGLGPGVFSLSRAAE